MEQKADFLENFKNPPEDYYTAPFFFLNDDLDEKNLTEALQEFKAKKIFRLFLHPRTGLEVDYLSEEFFKKIGFIIQKAEELGMKVYLYDEYNWPSGNCGGKLIRQFPQFKQIGLAYLIWKDRPGKEVNLELEGKGIAAKGVTKEDKIVDISKYLKDKSFKWKWDSDIKKVVIFFEKILEDVLFCSKAAPWTKWEHGYLDILSSEAVDKFIEMTHEEYRKRFGEKFGQSILGIFTDEPANYENYPWTTSFLEKFKEINGYDLRDKIEELALDRGSYQRTRCDYFEVASQLYAKNFYQKIGRWCEDNKIVFTGHLLGEESLPDILYGQGTFFPLLREMQLPGCDFLGDKCGYDNVPILGSLSLGPKLTSSVAHLTGRERVICETSGAAGWQINFETLKKVTNFLVACGVNLINQHASYLSIKGLRKRDFPESHFIQEPWWKYYQKYSDYAARSCFLAVQGRHYAPIAVLFPLRSLWSEFKLKRKSPLWNFMTESLESITNALLRIQRDFDFIFEEVFLEDLARIEEGKIKVEDEEYEMLIIPPMPVVSEKVLEKIEEFRKSGGKIIFTSILPFFSDMKENQGELIRRMEELTGIKLKKNQFAGDFQTVPLKDNMTLLKTKRVWGVKARERKWEKILDEAISSHLPKDIEVISENRRNLIYLHRLVDEKHFYFLANLSEKIIQGDLIINCCGEVKLLNQEDGEISPAKVRDFDEKKMTIPLNISPYNSFWLVIGTDKKPQKKEEILEKKIEKEIILPARWEIELKNDNLFLLDKWKIIDKPKISYRRPDVSFVDLKKKFFGWRTRNNIFYGWLFSPLIQKTYYSQFTSFRYLGWWDSLKMLSRMVFLTGIGSKDKGFMELGKELEYLNNFIGLRLDETFLPQGSEYTIKQNFIIKDMPEALDLVYEDLGEPVKIEINGEKVSQKPEKCFVWDWANVKVPIRNYLKQGKNNLIVRSNLPDWPGCFPATQSIEPFVLAGKFGVKGNKIVKMPSSIRYGSWTKQGFLHYIGEIVYKQKIQIAKEDREKNIVLDLGEVKEISSVRVNGKEIGVRAWHPFSLDLTEKLKEGENLIEISVCNTLANLLGNPIPSGILKSVKLKIF